jgi:hypothetical protein
LERAAGVHIRDNRWIVTKFKVTLSKDERNVLLWIDGALYSISVFHMYDVIAGSSPFILLRKAVHVHKKRDDF